jgi:RNase adapter protein RapZ
MTDNITHKLLIISGLSGSGKSIVLNALEDLDYYCIDNLPICLISELAKNIKLSPDGIYANTAIGIDARSRRSEIKRFSEILDKLRANNIEFETIFMQADDDVLLKRFSETRRKHPLTDTQLTLQDAIDKEKQLLAPIADHTDFFIDTSRTNVHQLRDLIRTRIHKHSNSLSILFQSFGFKHGSVSDADFVFDVRCLPNPHWEAQLRPLTGKDAAVIAFLEQQDVVNEMLQEIQQFLEKWVPHFQQDNQSYLTIAIGCTGGQHRSVYITEKLSQYFTTRFPQVITRHRELT